MKLPRKENGNEPQTMTDGICKYYHPNSDISTCKGGSIYYTCPYCGINECSLVAHGYHKCMKEKACCYLCGEKSKVMTPCHNSEHRMPRCCFAYYCPNCVEKATVRTVYSEKHEVFLIVECVKCPETLEERAKRGDG